MSITLKDDVKPGFVSVIIPVYRDVPGLRETLSSLTEQSLPESRFEILVANDGGDPGISDACTNYKVQEIRISPNRGSYYARNRAIEACVGEYLAFVDADITLPRTWLAEGVRSLENADYIGGPVVINKDQVRSPANYYDLVTAFRHNNHGANRRFYITANLFVRRSILDELGGFDQRLRSGGDNEFGDRVYRSGRFKQSFNDDLIVLHPPREFRELIRKRVRVAEGKSMLNTLYPDRYRFGRPSLLRHLVGGFAPPTIAGVKGTYTANPHFGFARYYFFCWKFKLVLTARLLPHYRAPHR